VQLSRVRIPTRARSLAAPLGVALAVLFTAVVLPRPAQTGDVAAAPKATAPNAPAERCHPLSSDAKDVCSSFVELEVKDVLPLAELQTHAVVLVSKDGKTMLPIFVDEAAAVSIAFRLAQRAPPHPLAQDLLDDVVSGMGGRVTEVRIDSLEDDIFVGRIVIRQGERDLALNARPSDSIAMAIKGGAPILANREVLDEAGIDEAEIQSLLEQQRQGPGVGGSGPLPFTPPSPEQEMIPGQTPIPERPTIEL